MPVKDIDILKAIILKEAETENLPQGFEDDPMGFIVKKYPGLHEVLIYLMTESFRDYVDAIFVVAPKPTTFKIVLHNGQFYFLQFMGKTYQATVSGKNYYLMSIGEKERCMLAIARILRYGNPLKTKGPEGAEQGTRPAGEEGGAGGEAPKETPEAGGEEGPVTESMILEAILKKTLNEDADSESGDDTKKYEIAATNKLNAQIKEIESSLPKEEKSITIVIKGKEYPEIDRAIVVKGSQNKSDINLVDSKGNSVIFISHKDVGGAKRFARWGSLQYLFNEGDPEVLNFRDNIYNYIKSLSNSGVALSNVSISKDNKIIFYSSANFSQQISSITLKNKLVFGKDFANDNYGLNNVQLVVQGDIVLKKYGDKPGFYEFDTSAAEKVWFSGDTPTGDYEPVLHAHWRGESTNELGIESCETMAKPIASVSGILWKAKETLDPENKYVPKDAIIIPKDQRKFLTTNGEREIFVTKQWYDKFIEKMKDKHKKSQEYEKYFDKKYAAPNGYVRIQPSFRKYFYLSV